MVYPQNEVLGKRLGEWAGGLGISVRQSVFIVIDRMGRKAGIEGGWLLGGPKIRSGLFFWVCPVYMNKLWMDCGQMRIP
jgi:hypothetical protein